jgi:hypothetical protein
MSRLRKREGGGKRDAVKGRWGAKVGIRDSGGRETFDVRLLPVVSTSSDEYKPFH